MPALRLSRSPTQHQLRRQTERMRSTFSFCLTSFILGALSINYSLKITVDFHSGCVPSGSTISTPPVYKTPCSSVCFIISLGLITIWFSFALNAHVFRFIFLIVTFLFLLKASVCLNSAFFHCMYVCLLICFVFFYNIFRSSCLLVGRSFLLDPSSFLLAFLSRICSKFLDQKQ